MHKTEQNRAPKTHINFSSVFKLKSKFQKQNEVCSDERFIRNPGCIEETETPTKAYSTSLNANIFIP